LNPQPVGRPLELVRRRRQIGTLKRSICLWNVISSMANPEHSTSVDRLVDATTQALDALHEIIDAQDSLPEALGRTARGATRTLADADAVTITVMREGEPETIACTDDRYLDIDKQQYAAGRGPCLEAARQHQPVRATTREHAEEWPEFAAAADEAGVRAYLSVPLVLRLEGRENELVGSLNLYSSSPAGFDPFDEALMRLFSTAAIEAINSARRWQQSRDHVANLEKALYSRSEIDQAKGALMAVHRCSADEAFRMLAQQSQNRNIKVNKLAVEFLDSLTRPHPDEVPRP
jgi:GAF domain-containing protein